MKRKYRIQPSAKAGYTPGKFVVQYYDPSYKVWFDASDPMSQRDAAERVAEEEQVIGNPTPAGGVKIGDQLHTPKGARTVTAVEPMSLRNGQDAVRIVYEADGRLRYLTLWPNSGLTVEGDETDG